MTRRLSNYIITIFFILCLTQSLIAKTTNEVPLDQIIATVNDAPIMQSELESALQAIRKQLLSQGTPLPSDAQLRKQVLDQLVNHKLQLQTADQSGVHVTEEEVDQTIDRIAKQNNITRAELFNKVAAEGLNAKEYRKDLQEALTLQKIQQQTIGPKINLTPEEVNHFMQSKAWQTPNTKEYHLEDILIALPENPSSIDVANAKKRADNIVLKLRQNGNFKSAAVAESGDSNALAGGDLGWRKLAEIPSAFTDNVTQMKPNEIAGPVQTANGFHIIHLVAIRNVSSDNKAAPTKEQAQQYLYQRKFEETLQSWITKLRSEAVIDLQPNKT